MYGRYGPSLWFLSKSTGTDSGNEGRYELFSDFILTSFVPFYFSFVFLFAISISICSFVSGPLK